MTKLPLRTEIEAPYSLTSLIPCLSPKNSQSFDSVYSYLHHFSQTKNLSAIKRIHGYLLTTGLLFLSLDFQAKLVLSYTRCHDHDNLQTSFNLFKCMNHRNPLPFNVIISDFCRNGLDFRALETLSFMHCNGVPIDTYALCSSLTASSSMKNVNFGKNVHAHVAKSGWSSSVFVGSALIDLYAKTLLITDAEILFDELPIRNTVCANALLSGYGEANMWTEGLELSRKMPMLNLDYDQFTLSAMLRACAGLSAIESGRQVHAFLLRSICNVGRDAFLQSSLIEMYGKCGLIAKAWQVFTLAGICGKGEKIRDIILWTSLLGVYSRNGYYRKVIELYREMLVEGIKPDGVAFVTVISACGRTGQVDLGIHYFESMSCDFKLEPGPEHYSCLVDLLCRASELDKAWKIVTDMLGKGHNSCSVSTWGALLNACMERGNVELGKEAACRALELDPHNTGIYVLLSNLYARFCMWDEIGKLRESMKEQGLKKDVGCSWIEVTS